MSEKPRLAAKRKAYKDSGRGECAVCAAVLPLDAAGRVPDHYPADLAHAYFPARESYCRGNGRLPARVIRLGKNKTGKPREPSPDVAALMDPNYTVADFEAALGKIAKVPPERSEGSKEGVGVVPPVTE